MHSPELRARARDLRFAGAALPEISRELDISKSTAHAWCIDIELTDAQKVAIQKRRCVHRMTPNEKRIASERLAQYRFKYSRHELLARISNFFTSHGRIPLKREFNAWGSYAAEFGSWNAAIMAAGFEPNPVLFAHRFKAKDGHACDSFSEMVIDDWLSQRGIIHERNVPYEGTRFTADFSIGTSVLIEFFGLAGVQEEYDRNIIHKRYLASKSGKLLIEVYPKDIYPDNTLAVLLKGIS